MNKVSFSAHAKIPQNHPVSVYFCGREHCEKGQITGPIMRTQYLFCYVVSGRGAFRARTNKMNPVTAGQGFLVFPDQVTTFVADKEDPWDYLWFAFDGTEVPGIISDIGFTEKYPVFTDAEGGCLKEIVANLVEVYQNDRNDKYNVLSLFYSIMAYMQTSTSPRRLGEASYVEKALDYIHHNFVYRIRIEDISRYVGLDRTYLFKLFVKNIGTAPQEYLIRYRLEHAVDMLQQSRLSTSQIAASCGFRDAPSFCKHFKARYGVPPLAYRKKSRQEASEK